MLVVGVRESVTYDEYAFRRGAIRSLRKRKSCREAKDASANNDNGMLRHFGECAEKQKHALLTTRMRRSVPGT